MLSRHQNDILKLMIPQYNRRVVQYPITESEYFLLCYSFCSIKSFYWEIKK